MGRRSSTNNKLEKENSPTVTHTLTDIHRQPFGSIDGHIMILCACARVPTRARRALAKGYHDTLIKDEVSGAAITG